ncbi:hypothetical protein VP1G_10463 [Cytospora mali]|uniref:Zn(2)-C6 fungal-type domain-containing protein n=1 Tax=Cytospora mali TaxID=578113 RepID=A0A194VHP7_CYTMA|nr:hypothetical protein VP1G_10463 [Valsa mali var. pyri (nom. inval.)]
MSYHYPPPGTPPPPYDAGYSIPPHSSGMDTRSPGQSGRNESDPSPTSFELKRSSHPDVRMVEREPGPEQANMGASADKKRGKLQYQRISVACTNCRRRKIRCVQAAGAAKCNQCKRLHKDCVVEAVDQRNPADTRNKSISRPSLGQKLASASSSPAMSSGRPGIHAGRQHAAMPMPPIQHMPLADAPDVRRTSIGRGYPEYDSSSMTNWMAPDASPGSSRARHSNASWTPYSQGSTIAPTYSPYTHSTSPSASWTAPVPGDSTTRDGMQWSTYPPPNPSFTAMSQMTANAYGRRTPNAIPSADMYPSVPSMGSPPMGQAAPLSPPQPAAHATSFGSWQQPYPPPMAKPGDNFGNWYAEGEGSQSQPGPSGAAQHQIEHAPPTTEGYYSHR